MTAQIPDQVLLDGVEYAIAGVSGTGLFEPADHGLETVMMNTACWRGWIAGYDVEDGALRLSRLTLGPGTRRDGRPLALGEDLLGRPLTRAPKWLSGAFVVQDLRLPVGFTGGLLLGADFVQETYRHMGFHPAWKFSDVVELIVDGGRCSERRDHSAAMAALRERIMSGQVTEPDGTDISTAWVERTFTLDYSCPGL